VPEVEAPDGSGCVGLVGADGACLGLVPEVEGVGEERGVFEEVEGSPVVLELWNCVFFSSQKSVDVCSFKFCPQFFPL